MLYPLLHILASLQSTGILSLTSVEQDIFCLNCFFSLAHLWVSAVACSSCSYGIIITALCKQLDSTAYLFPPLVPSKNWVMFFKATQLDLHWFIARAFYWKNVHISLLASRGKLSSGLQVVWSVSSSSSMIRFPPSLSQSAGSSSGCVFRPLLRTFFCTWAQLT